MLTATRIRRVARVRLGRLWRPRLALGARVARHLVMLEDAAAELEGLLAEARRERILAADAVVAARVAAEMREGIRASIAWWRWVGGHAS